MTKSEGAGSIYSSLPTTEKGISSRNVLKLPERTILPFLIPKCIAVDSKIRISEVYMAKVLYHRSYLEKHYFPKTVQ